jgi:hypothetical protein
MKKLTFLKKFAKYFSLGLSILVIFAALNQSDLKRAFAQEYDDGTTDTTFVSYPDEQSEPQPSYDQQVGDGTTDTTFVSYPDEQSEPIQAPTIYTPATSYSTNPDYGNVSGNQLTPYQPTTQPEQPADYITYEGPDCWSNESWWVRDWSDGSREWLMNHGVRPGECGNPLEQTQPAAPIEQVQAPAQTQVQPQQIANAPAQQQQTTQVAEQRCANGSVSSQGLCVIQQQSNPQQINFTPHIVAQGGSAIAQVGSVNTGSVRQEANPIVFTTTRTTPVEQNTPIAIQVAKAECPAGTTKKSVVNNQIVCEMPAQQVTTVETKQPVVTVAGVSETKELPKTGLPLLAWAAAAFLPAGLRLRRIGKGVKETFSPSYIFESRQFSK